MFFVEQDLYLNVLTVEETINFAAKLRMPSNSSKGILHYSFYMPGRESDTSGPLKYKETPNNIPFFVRKTLTCDPYGNFNWENPLWGKVLDVSQG